MQESGNSCQQLFSGLPYLKFRVRRIWQILNLISGHRNFTEFRGSFKFRLKFPDYTKRELHSTR